MLKKMIGRKTKKLTAFIAATTLLGSLMGLTFVPGAYALNSTGGKAFNVWGYKYDYTAGNKLIIYLDKNATSYIDTNGYQFKVHDETANTDESFTMADVQGVSGSNGISTPSGSPNGTIVTLTFPSNLPVSHEFQVSVSQTLIANSGMTLGATYKNEDRLFEFKSPDSMGQFDYSNVHLSLRPLASDTGIPVEGNVGFISDVPLSANDTSAILNNMHLEINGTTVPMDNFQSGQTGKSIYQPVATDWKTGFFMPLSWGSTNTNVYDLQFNTTYTWKIPALTDAGLSAQSLTFTTHASPDFPSAIVYAPTWNSSTHTINWLQSTTNCTGYNVYKSTDKYWNYQLLATVNGNTTTSYQWNNYVSGTYIRVAPIGGGGEGGFTPALQIP